MRKRTVFTRQQMRIEYKAIPKRESLNKRLKSEIIKRLRTLNKFTGQKITLKEINHGKIINMFEELNTLCLKINENKTITRKEKQEHISAIKKGMIDYYNKNLKTIFEEFTSDKYNIVGSSSFKAEKMTVQEKFKEYQRKVEKYITTL